MKKDGTFPDSSNDPEQSRARDPEGVEEQSSELDDAKMLAVAQQLREAYESMCQGNVLASIKTANALFRARMTLSPGDFDQLWALAEQKMQIKFDLERFLYVGEKLMNLDRELCKHLPPHWAVLYCVAQVKQEIVRAAVESRKLHPYTTLKQAEQLLGVSRYGPAGPRPDEDPSLYFLDDLAEELRELGLAPGGGGFPPQEYPFEWEHHGCECGMSIEIDEEDKTLTAWADFGLSAETSDYVEFDKTFPLKTVTAKKISDWIQNCAKELRKPGFKSRHKILNRD